MGTSSNFRPEFDQKVLEAEKILNNLIARQKKIPLHHFFH